MAVLWSESFLCQVSLKVLPRGTADQSLKSPPQRPHPSCSHTHIQCRCIICSYSRYKWPSWGGLKQKKKWPLICNSVERCERVDVRVIDIVSDYGPLFNISCWVFYLLHFFYLCVGWGGEYFVNTCFSLSLSSSSFSSQIFLFLLSRRGVKKRQMALFFFLSLL